MRAIAVVFREGRDLTRPIRQDRPAASFAELLRDDDVLARPPSGTSVLPSPGTKSASSPTITTPPGPFQGDGFARRIHVDE